jgi:hypothetical protein
MTYLIIVRSTPDFEAGPMPPEAEKQKLFADWSDRERGRTGTAGGHAGQLAATIPRIQFELGLEAGSA